MKRGRARFCCGLADFGKKNSLRLKQLEAGQDLADDLEIAKRRLFVIVVGVVGNDFHPRAAWSSASPGGA